MTPAELDALLNEPNEEYFNWNADWGLRAAVVLVQLHEENAWLLHSKQYACLAHVGEVNKGGPCVWCDLVNLRDSKALARGKIAEQMIKIEWLERMKQNYYDEAVKGWSKCRAAEAELDTQNRALAQCRALLKQEIDDVVPLRERIAALEAERDALKQDVVWLLQRARAIINRWQELYGEHQPQFLPPAHQIEWAEDASEFIDAAREKP